MPAPLLVNGEVPDWKTYKSSERDGKPAGTLRDALRYANDSNGAASACEADRTRVMETQKKDE